MRLVAYVLAADPVWIIPSVRSYYDIVDEIVVSYDKHSRGWTGHAIPVDECLDRIHSIDRDKKLKLLAGEYARPSADPMENDTFQRQCAIDSIGARADWILQLDTDEIMPDASQLAHCLEHEVPPAARVLEWPMRAFFQRTPRGHFLEVTSFWRRRCSEYPGPIATRPGVQLTRARRTEAPVWRVGIRKSDTDPHTRRRYRSHQVIDKAAAVLHMSWVRTEDDLRRKLRTWSHSADFDAERYLEHVWRPARRRWITLHNFHPVYPRLWPALWPTRLPVQLLKGGLE
jgi:hypothetical protein